MARGVIAGIMLTAFSTICLAQTTWPTIALPKDASAFDMGGQLAVNGMPLRMQGFVSPTDPVRLAAWFRQSLGRPFVENNVGNKLVLGRLQGEHYLTVQLESAGSGTRGLVAVTQLKATYDKRADTQATTERWLNRLPSGSRLLSQVESDDGGKHATHLVIVNESSADLNRSRIKEMMREDGLALEREAVADSKTAALLPVSMATSKTLFFKGGDKEAMAVIHRDETGRTAIVLNTVTLLAHVK